MFKALISAWRRRTDAARREAELIEARLARNTAHAAWLDAKARRDTRDMARYGEACRTATLREMGMRG